jgi:hypothetical protein
MLLERTETGCLKLPEAVQGCLKLPAVCLGQQQYSTRQYSTRQYRTVPYPRCNGAARCEWVGFFLSSKTVQKLGLTPVGHRGNGGRSQC